MPIITAVRIAILATSFAFVITFIVKLLWDLGNSRSVRTSQVPSFIARAIPNTKRSADPLPRAKTLLKALEFAIHPQFPTLIPPQLRWKKQTEMSVPNLLVRSGYSGPSHWVSGILMV